MLLKNVQVISDQAWESFPKQDGRSSKKFHGWLDEPNLPTVCTTVSEAGRLTACISHESPLSSKIQEVYEGCSWVASIDCQGSSCNSFHLGFIGVMKIFFVWLHSIELLGMGTFMRTGIVMHPRRLLGIPSNAAKAGRRWALGIWISVSWNARLRICMQLDMIIMLSCLT